MDGVVWWTKQNDAFMLGKDRFYVAKEQKKGYKYAGFESVDDYISGFVGVVKSNLRRKNKIPLVFNELIAQWKPRRIYFDIDYEKNKKYEFDPDLFIDELLQCVAEELKVHGHNLELESIFVLSSCGKIENDGYKYSYHIVITDYYVEDSYQSRCFTEKVRERMEKRAVIPRQLLIAIDPGVYSNNRCMRIAGCAKYGQTRYAELCPFVYDGNVREYDYDETSLVDTWDYTLRNTIIQNVSGIEISYPGVGVPSFEYATEMTQKIYDSVVSVIEQSVPETTIFTRDGQVAFQSGKVTASSILFDRLESSHCDICQRVHDSVGYVIFVNADGDIFRHCFRSPKKTVKVGNHKSKIAIKPPNIFVRRLQSVVDMKRMEITGDVMVKHLMQTMGVIIYGEKFGK